jgi:ferredoxin-type protein NapH
VRKFVQLGVLILLLLPGLLPGNVVWLGTFLSSHFLTIPLTDPLAALEVMLAAREFIWPLFLSAVPLLLVSVIMGRVFCGWVCPLNTVLEMVALVTKPQHMTKPLWQPYWFLGAVLILSAVAGLPLFTLISPIGIVSRALVFGAGIELALILLLIFIELFYGRKFWCRKICPVGALYSIVGRYRPLKIELDDSKCIQCGKCYQQCSMGVNVGSNRPQELRSCISCGECTDVCGEKAVGFAWKLPRKGGAIRNEPDTGAAG